MSVPNQRKIIIERTTDTVRKDYLKVSNESLYTAMYNLKNSAFKLWVYFADNMNGYAIDLYPVDFCSKSGISDSTYRRAFDELQDLGYLIKSEKNDNLFLFKEQSQSEKIKRPDEVNSINSKDLDRIIKEYF